MLKPTFRPLAMDHASEMLKALAHPTRLSIVELLSEKKSCTVSQIQEALGMEQAVVSQQLSILKMKHVLVCEREGKNSVYSLKYNCLSKIIACLKNATPDLRMELIGYFAAILIGISLGLIGGGGSSLALPVLVYLFHINAQTAVMDSFFIVGVASLVGALTYILQKQICYKSVLTFGLPSVLTVFFAHRVLFKAIPERIIIGNLTDISKDMLILLIFSVLMIAASLSMIYPTKSSKDSEVQAADYPYFRLIMGGIGVGLLAGLVGAGGGFLIIPALVILIRMPMKKAIGTSLMIITINSAVGMLSHLSDHNLMSWPFLLSFCGLAVGGILIGKYISRFVSGNTLKPAFGWFILIIGAFIISQQFYRIHS